MNPVTLIGLSIIFFYSLTQILKFYGIDESVYGAYILFYIFIIICILVLPNDPNDDSEIKKQRLNDSSLKHNCEIQTLRISDHDGIWTKTYDSVYLGNIELDDGSFIEETPLIVLKDYKQQIPLSFHFINKSSIGNKYDSTNHSYRII